LQTYQAKTVPGKTTAKAVPDVLKSVPKLHTVPKWNSLAFNLQHFRRLFTKLGQRTDKSSG
jgi:hypothetical protein